MTALLSRKIRLRMAIGFCMEGWHLADMVGTFDVIKKDSEDEILASQRIRMCQKHAKKMAIQLIESGGVEGVIEGVKDGQPYTVTATPITHDDD